MTKTGVLSGISEPVSRSVSRSASRARTSARADAKVEDVAGGPQNDHTLPYVTLRDDTYRVTPGAKAGTVATPPIEDVIRSCTSARDYRLACEAACRRLCGDATRLEDAHKATLLGAVEMSPEGRIVTSAGIVTTSVRRSTREIHVGDIIATLLVIKPA